MAAGGVCMRRLLLAAIMLSLVICLQEVTAKSGGEGSAGGEDDKGGKGDKDGKSDKGGKEGEGGKDGEGGEGDKDGEGGKGSKGGEGDKAGEDGEGGEDGKGSKGGEGDKAGEDGEGGKGGKGSKGGKGGEARSKKPGSRKTQRDEESSEPDVTENDVNFNETDSRNSTFEEPRLACPKECAEWKLEVLALCGNELKGFDNLCYFFQHKCNNPTDGCHFYCCLYPGTDVATASKFDCDDMCRF